VYQEKVCLSGAVFAACRRDGIIINKTCATTFINLPKLLLGMRLHDHYAKNRDNILSRLEQFRMYQNGGFEWKLVGADMVFAHSDSPLHHLIFEELAFCLLTANTSAATSMKAVDTLRPVLKTGTLEDLKSALKSAGYRFPNKRAEYIYEARQNHYCDLKDKLDSFSDPREARQYLVESIKGLGFKEASHFLRNIGYPGLAILDKHVLRCLKEQGVIEEVPKTLNQTRYLEIEGKMQNYSRDIGIDIDELDLLLWSSKNGSIMK
jgi:N-glycosylase/DNA lyase